MIVNVGLAASALGKVELSEIQRFGTSKLRPSGSMTASAESVPIRQVPIVCAVHSYVRVGNSALESGFCSLASESVLHVDRMRRYGDTRSGSRDGAIASPSCPAYLNR